VEVTLEAIVANFSGNFEANFSGIRLYSYHVMHLSFAARMIDGILSTIFLKTEKT